MRKKVRVRDYDRQQLVINTKLNKDSYYPGESVTADLTVQRADGAPLEAGSSFSYQVNFGSSSASEEGKVLTGEGKSFFKFQIPTDASLQFTTISIRVDSGEIEALSSKTLIIAQPEQMVVDFFPETGFNAPGTPHLIYFQAWSSNGRDEIVDFQNAKLIEVSESDEENVLSESVSTDHRGKGRVQFDWQNGHSYFLEIQLGGGEPVRREINLRATTEVNFHLAKTVLQSDEDLAVTFYPTSLTARFSVYYFAIQHKEREIYSEQIKFDSLDQPLEITIPAGNFPLPNGGVLTANLFKMDQMVPYLTDDGTVDVPEKPQEPDNNQDIEILRQEEMEAREAEMEEGGMGEREEAARAEDQAAEAIDLE